MIYSQIFFNQKDVDFVEGHTDEFMSEELSDTIFNQMIMRAIQPANFLLQTFYNFLDCFLKNEYLIIKNVLHSRCIIGRKYASNSEYDRHDDTRSCVSLMKEGKSNNAQIKNIL